MAAERTKGKELDAKSIFTKEQQQEVPSLSHNFRQLLLHTLVQHANGQGVELDNDASRARMTEQRELGSPETYNSTEAVNRDYSVTR